MLGWWCPCHDSKAWVVLSYLLITLILSSHKPLSPNNSYLPITAVFQSGPQCWCINPAVQWSWCCPEERIRGWQRFPSLHCPCVCWRSRKVPLPPEMIYTALTQARLSKPPSMNPRAAKVGDLPSFQPLKKMGMTGEGKHWKRSRTSSPLSPESSSLLPLW